MPAPFVAPPPSRKSTAFAYKLAAYQVERPFVPLAITGVLTLISLAFALRLKILTGFEFLLPQDRPSVVELNRVAAKTAGVSALFVVLKGGPDTSTDKLRAAADALVPELTKLGPPWVGSAEDGVHDALKFLEPRAGLFVDKAKLEKLKDDVDARFAYEVGKATGTQLDDEPPPEINAKSLEKTFGVAEAGKDRYPGGYYQSKDGKAVVVAVRSKVLGSDFKNGTEAIRLIREVVDR
ncbi:MAG TPA: hypothetical protein VGM56_15680, partial [Byssovorax sp.]